MGLPAPVKNLDLAIKAPLLSALRQRPVFKELMAKKLVNKSLVGGIPTPLQNMRVNWDDDIPNI